MTAPEGRDFDLRGGRVGLDAAGLVSSVRGRDGRHFLLREDADAPEHGWHGPGHRWGTGYLTGTGGAFRWEHPDELVALADGVDLTYRLGDLTLAVRRRFGPTWDESYHVSNTGRAAVEITGFAISTPWRDLYSSAADSLAGAVHAHVWTGGSDSWVWAEPMDGSRPALGLRLTAGALHAYSVESRNSNTGSDVRGHLYLHPTDRVRNPAAIGGQPVITLDPGRSYELGWRIGWYTDIEELIAEVAPLVDAELETGLAVERGRPVMLRLAPGAVAESPTDGLGDGVHDLWVGRGTRRSRVAVLVHPPVRELVEARVRFLLDRQRPVERAGSRGSAFLPLDLDTGLRVPAGGWADWNDGRERIGSAQLLRETLRLGWGEQDELTDALAGYRDFVLDHLVTDDGTVLDGSGGADRVRLYNFPWFARFLLDAGDHDKALLIMERYYALGGDHFLAFGVGSVLSDLAGVLTASGREQDAGRTRGWLLDHATRMIGFGTQLPAHEVAYEQSMVAPLLDLLIMAHRTDPDRVPVTELSTRLPWLTAFGSVQPDVRLRHIPIRHWDGYWFGRERLWGDVFPHYWSILSAGVFLDWPEDAAEPDVLARLRSRGRAILRANLANFAADGSATCAFVYPSSVDGRPAHRADPLVNDQDWALVYLLRYRELSARGDS